MTQERRRYGFVLERQCSLAKHYASFHEVALAALHPSVDKWREVAATREYLPQSVEDMFASRLRVNSRRSLSHESFILASFALYIVWIDPSAIKIWFSRLALFDRSDQFYSSWQNKSLRMGSITKLHIYTFLNCQNFMRDSALSIYSWRSMFHQFCGQHLLTCRIYLNRSPHM